MFLFFVLIVAGVMHRDLKPSNIFVDLNCDIKLGDLGMAKCVNFNQNAFVPMTEYVATRWYRAPEIMLWKRYGFEVDVWSVGCIMAELLTRKPLFPGQDLQDQLRKVFSIMGSPSTDFIQQIQSPRIVKWVQSQTFHTKQPLSKVIPGVSNEAIDLLEKMLQCLVFIHSVSSSHSFLLRTKSRPFLSLMCDFRFSVQTDLGVVGLATSVFEGIP